MTSIDRVIADALTADRLSQPVSARPEYVIVTVPRDSVLEALLTLEDSKRTAYETAKQDWDEYRSALEARVMELYPGDLAPTKGFEIPGGPMWKGMTLNWTEGREFLANDLIRQHIPQVWNAFKKQSKGYWTLRRKGAKSR